MIDGGHIISRAEASRELLRRRRARVSLVDFSQAIEIPGAPISEDPDEWLFKPIESSVAHHHRVLMDAIQRCIERPYGRLMIFMPPGSAKTTYTSVVAPAWAMGKYPGFKVIATSYSQTPADRFSKRCRQIVRSPEYRSIFDARLQDGSTAVNEWTLTNDSTMLAAGLMGSITSARADLGIIDDPVAGREEADSEIMRRKTRQAYDDDFLTRLKPKASIILMQTRWHLDDLAGGILPEDYNGESGLIECRDGQVWEVLNIPARAERNDDPLGRKPGDYLWPEWFDRKHWKIFERNVRTWNALYQQRPSSSTGGTFSQEMFSRYTKTPKGLNWLLSSDFAVTEKTLETHPDFTEHGIIGIDEDGDLWLETGRSSQKRTRTTVKQGLDLARAYGATEWLIEKGVILNAVQDTIETQIEERAEAGDQINIGITPMASNKDKVSKSSAFQERCEAGKVHVKTGAWGDSVIAQLCAFPFGRYDDKVDMCGQAGRYANQVKPHRSESKKKKRLKPMTAPWVTQAREEDEEQTRREQEHYT